MKICLHIGAHRCATTTFQHYMRSHSDALRGVGVGYWGPRRTRTGLFSGVQPRAVTSPGDSFPMRRAIGRLRLNLMKSAQKGVETLIVSDENIIGSMFQNVETGRLYPATGERLTRFDAAFDGKISDVVLSVRAQDSYWPSVIGHLVPRGHGPWSPTRLRAIAEERRTWRDVITDLACALPGTRVRVAPFETFADQPDTLLRAMVPGLTAPRALMSEKRNATLPSAELRALANDAMAAQLPGDQARWSPFDSAARAALREAYADDIMWLRGGADGLAQLMDDPDRTQPDKEPDHIETTRGNGDDRKENPMAQARRKRIARQASRDPYLENARRY